MSHSPGGDFQGMFLKVSERAHGLWQLLMRARNNFPEGDFPGVPLKVKIIVDAGCLIFPKVNAKVCPWKSVKEIMDADNGSRMLSMIFPKVIFEVCPWKLRL